MYLIVRSDITIPTGKGMVQSGHAFATALVNSSKIDPDLVDHYIANAQPKIVVKCKNAEALQRAERECKAVELNCFLVTDAGRTVFPEPTMTCMAIGPCKRGDLPKFIQRMQLLD